MTRVGLLVACAAVIVAGGAILLIAPNTAAPADPSEWQQRQEYRGDFQRYHEASLTEIGGSNTLKVDCSNQASFGVFRTEPFDPPAPTRISYRTDRSAPVQAAGFYNGSYVWFDRSATADLDPMIRAISRAQRLTVQVAPSGSRAFTMRFDVSGTAQALHQLETHCRGQ